MKVLYEPQRKDEVIMHPTERRHKFIQEAKKYHKQKWAHTLGRQGITNITDKEKRC